MLQVVGPTRWGLGSCCWRPHWECPKPFNGHVVVSCDTSLAAGPHAEWLLLISRAELDSKGWGEEPIPIHLEVMVSVVSESLSCHHWKRLCLRGQGRSAAAIMKYCLPPNLRPCKMKSCFSSFPTQLLSGLAASDLYSWCIIKKPFPFISQAVCGFLKCPLVTIRLLLTDH